MSFAEDDLEVEKLRARRRRVSETIALKRYMSYVHIGLNGLPQTQRGARAFPAFYDKQHPWSCPCGKRRPGRPRADYGVCKMGERKRIYRWRRQNRAWRDAIRAGRFDEDSDEL